MESNDDLFDPYIAVNVKEAMNTPGESELSYNFQQTTIQNFAPFSKIPN